MTLDGKVALVTGVRRIGASVALELAQAGADVCVCYFRSRERATEVVKGIERFGRNADAICADLTRDGEADHVVGLAERRFGRIDILVTMASTYKRVVWADIEERHWDEGLGVDLDATFACARAAVPAFRRAGGGRIVTCADWVAASGRPRYFGYLPYFVAKRCVIALTEALALELAGENILVNCVAPGPILPPDSLTIDQIRAYARETPLGRWGGDQEIAKTVLALVATDFMTGETVRVDGARHLR